MYKHKNKGICIIEGCSRPIWAREVCPIHYSRFQRNGDLVPRKRGRKPTEKRKCSVHGCPIMTIHERCDMHENRLKKYGDVHYLNPIAKKSRESEKDVARLFLHYGHAVEPQGYKSPFDILVNKTLRVEVKTASRCKDGKWRFSIHRAGELKEDCDCYVFQFLGVPGSKNAVYAMFRSPFGVKTREFTLMGMVKRMGPHYELMQRVLRTGKLDKEEEITDVCSICRRPVVDGKWHNHPCE
jgi:hypothetical protein